MFNRLPLKTKLLIVSSISLIFTVSIIVAMGYYSNYKETMTTYRGNQIRSVNTFVEIVGEYVGKYETSITALGSSFHAENTAAVDLLYRKAIENMMSELRLSSLFIAFEDGTLIYNNSYKKPENYDFKVRGWWKTGIASSSMYISDVFKGASSGRPLITITYPIQTQDGVKGLFVYNIDLDLTFLNEYANRNVQGTVYVFDRILKVVSAEQEDMLLKDAKDLFSDNLNKYLQNPADYNSKNEEVHYMYKGNNRIAYALPVSDTGLVILYSMDTNLMIQHIRSNAANSIIFSIILLMIANGFLFFVVKLSLRDVVNIQKQIIAVASSKDLSMRIKSISKDELGQIASASNDLLESMDKVIHEVRNSIVEVASANNELAATMEELSATFNSQSSQVADMVEGMDNISEISRTTSDALSANMTSLEETANATRMETEKLDKVSTDMSDIEKDTVELAETIKSLSVSSAEIGNILSVINDIANQTNLLALNAAIEAARAGEAGRGFAVVADEVRKLAERTQDATKEIETIITGLQQESENASQAMDKSVISVQEGTSNIQNVTGEIQRAVEQVTLLYTGMQPVSDAVSDQYTLVQNVVENARGISAGIDESNSAVSEVNNTVAHLQQRTEYLKQLIEQFKV